MKKTFFLIIGLVALFAVNSANAQKQPLEAPWTWVYFNYNIMETGVDLSTALVTFHIHATYHDIFGQLQTYDYTYTQPAINPVFHTNKYLENGYVDVTVHGTNAWGTSHTTFVPDANSYYARYVYTLTDVYKKINENPHL